MTQSIDQQLAEKYTGPKYLAKSTALGGNIHRITFTLKETGQPAPDQTFHLQVVFTEKSPVGYITQPYKI